MDEFMNEMYPLLKSVVEITQTIFKLSEIS